MYRIGAQWQRFDVVIVEIYSAPLAYRELILFYANTQKACGVAFNTRMRRHAYYLHALFIVMVEYRV